MGKKLILCLDDEKIILESLKMQLKSALQDEYDYEFSQDAEEGLEILEESIEDGIEVVVIVSDWLMPGMKGDEFLIKIHKKYPKVVKILLSGQVDEEALKRVYKEANLYKMLEKPWDKNEMITTIREGLAKQKEGNRKNE